ncbi:PDZ domain-containing protein [Streptomyces lasalocidi]|uniref:PDZ domain-containing protein n=1 Tax=Streptomyces lasalocidi TaxID=324833 RepID=A0A4U5WNA1_STRLS|nr:PDZ domain-containing protein [Streptomyces lasalocidi]TKT03370.1 PDZ domain-containing protein [Streptomyces lasalocidi]
MEQTALRPKPLPGQEPTGPRAGDAGTGPGPAPHRPHAARRRGRRLTTLLLGLLAGVVLVLTGVGLGTVGATVIGMSKLAELQRQAAAAPTPAGPPTGTRTGPAHAAPAPVPARATLGVEVVDAYKAGAKVVAVHVPGPGYTAGLVRGDVVLWCGRTRVETAADLARAVAGASPGKEVKLTVRHRSGGYQQLVAVPGVVT